MFTVRRPVGAGQEMDFVQASSSSGELKRVGAPPNWRSKASAIKNQGQCGACWAFTSVGLYESWMKFKGQQEYDLSEEFLLECTNSLHSNNYTSDCTGGYTDFALQVVKNYGIPTETTWPYKAATYGSVRGFPSSPGICSTNQSFIKYNSLPGAKDPLNVTRYDNRTVAQIETLLAEGPLGAMMYVDATFQAYRGGVYTLCPSFNQAFNGINHAVVIVGMDADKNYIIKNSWGTAWGDSGFATVSSVNDCALSAYVFKLSWGYQLVGSSLLFLLGLLVLFA